MTKKYRVALIGAGIAERHLFGYSWIKDLFDVRVLCSLDEERGGPLAEKYGVPEYTQDTDSLFAREDIDIIDICTPPANHFELCERALAAVPWVKTSCSRREVIQTEPGSNACEVICAAR